MPLTFLQELQVDLGDLFEPLLNLGKAVNALLHLPAEFLGHGDLPHAPAALTQGEDPDGAVSFALGFLAKAAGGFVAAHHATHQGTGEGDGGIGELLDQAFTSSQKMFRRRIHGGLFSSSYSLSYIHMKDTKHNKNVEGEPN